MAVVPASHTFSSGTVATSSEANTYIRDPIAFLLNRPIANLRQTVVQSIANAAGVAITFDAEDFDTANGHDNVTNNSRYTAVYAGRYLLGGGVSYAANATGVRGAYWYVNGSTVAGTEVIIPASGGGIVTSVPARSVLTFLNVGDYVELIAYQTSGGALNTGVTGGGQSSASVEWVSN